MKFTKVRGVVTSFTKKFTSVLLGSTLMLSGLAPALPLLTQTAYAAPQDLFSDSFESGDFSAWDYSGANWHTSAGDVQDGTKRAQFEGSYPLNDAQLIKNIDTTGFEDITVEFYYRRNGLDTGEYGRFGYNAGTGNNLLTQYNGGSSNDDDSWQHETYSLPADAANNPNLSIYFEALADNPNDHFRIDNVIVTGEPISSPPAVEPTLSAVANYRIDAEYHGISVEITTPDLTDATSVEISVERTNGAPDTWSNRPTSTAAINGLSGPLHTTTAPIVIVEGIRTRTSSSSWQTTGDPWTSGQVPQSVTVRVHRSGGATLEQTMPIGNTWGTEWSDIAPLLPATTTEVVSGNTSAGENQPGWMFNRDVTTSTPFEFNTGAASIGTGSLYVKPIGSNPSDKFIGEYFLLKPIDEVNSISYDFKVAPSLGVTPDVGNVPEHYYMNAYVNFNGDMSDYGHCVYNVIPTVAADWTTVTFDPNQNYDVRKRDSSPAACPASPADVPGGVLRMFAINLGDTSANDTGLSGYFDKVVVNTDAAITTYDFEPSGPDPTDSHQLTLSGLVFHNLNSDRDRDTGEDVLSDWTVRAYKEDTAGNWQLVGDTTTRPSDDKYAIRQNEASIYHVCLVNKAGWTQIRQDWSGTPYHLITENLSGATDEGEWCSTVNYDDTADRSNAKYFGVLDTKKPFTEVLSPASGGVYNDSFSVNVRTTDNESGIVKAVANLYGPSGLIGSCVNQTVSPAAAQHDYTCDVNVASLSDGDYYLKINSKDVAGNVSNTVVWNFTVDKTAPAAPTIIAPGARTWHKSSPIANKWTAATDINGISHYQIAYHYDDNHSFGGSTCPGEVIDGKTVSGCRDVNGTSRNHQPADWEQGGVTIWVRAIDNAGNIGPWSQSVHYYYDHEAPTTDINVSPVVGGVFTVSGNATDNLALNRVYVQLVSRVSNQRCGGTTINLIPEGASANWSQTYDIATLGCPEGNYAAHVTVTDMAGNSSTAGWTTDFLVDATAPVVTIDPVADGTDITPTITGTTDESSVTVVVDGVSYFPTVNPDGTWSVTTNVLSVGNYTVSATSTDAAGNSTTVTDDFNVNATLGVQTSSLPPQSQGGHGAGDQRLPKNANLAVATSGDTQNQDSENGDSGEQKEVENAETLAATNTENKPEQTVANSGSGGLFGISWLWIALIAGGVGSGGLYFAFARRSNEG